MILGIDVGTTAVKALLLDEAGQVIAEDSHLHDLRTPRPGWAEEDVEDWWRGVVATTRSILAGRNPKSVCAVGVSGMVPAVVLLDEEGRVLRPSIQQNDVRAILEIETLRARINEDWLFRKTGATWNQQVVAPKLLWLQRNEPDVWRRVHRVAGAYEYVTWRLTGAVYCEANWALESGFWDAHHETWLADMLEVIGMEGSKMPPVRKSHEVVGSVTKDAAQATGIAPGTPVIAGSADHIAALLAAGVATPGQAVLKLGGAGDFLYAVDSFAPVRELFIDYHSVPGLFVLNGCMATTGSLVKWFVQEMRPDATFSILDREAELVPAGSDGLVVLPYFLGEKTPIHDPRARGTIVGLTLAHRSRHLYRAILEGIAYAFRHHLDVLRDRGYPVSEVYAVDGGARSALWRSILASVLREPILYVPMSHIGSAFGVAFLAGVAVGLWDWNSLRERSRDPDSTDPDPSAAEIYERRYAVYRETYRRFRDLYPRLD